MVGAVIGNYQIVRKLGEGGMGVVYLGQHTLLGRRAAIKVLLPALSARPDIVNRFFNEARAVTTISDPGIVQVFDFGYHSDGSAFIVMEFLEGEALDQRLAKRGRLPAYEALRLCRQIATSLAAAHAQHIIHRDLKPENIFLVRDAEVASGERSKILDFGIAKLSDEQPGQIKTHAGALMGTPVYMSPEQCRGLADIDHRSDIYALGCVMFHLIVGRPPFEGEGIGDIISAHIREPAPAPSSRLGGVPAVVDALLLRCLAKAPADRFQTMTELAQAIGPVLQQLPSEAGSFAGYDAGPSLPPYSQPPGTPPPPG
ncbi:MAG: serine/threonine protein kinase, partial [Myxococcales bacterium]|nr:serine/threonine protein kinase [Myxococcales bacterium]